MHTQSKPARKTIVINGISVTADECSHCKQIPSDQEARDAVLKAQAQHRWAPCAYCGEPVKVTAFHVHHDDVESWVVCEAGIEFESNLALTIETSEGREIDECNWVHSRCLKKALPHVRGMA